MYTRLNMSQCCISSFALSSLPLIHAYTFQLGSVLCQCIELADNRSRYIFVVCLWTHTNESNTNSLVLPTRANQFTIQKHDKFHLYSYWPIDEHLWCNFPIWKLKFKKNIFQRFFLKSKMMDTNHLYIALWYTKYQCVYIWRWYLGTVKTPSVTWILVASIQIRFQVSFKRQN